MKSGNENKMLKHAIKTLLHRLLHQFRSNSYDCNSILYKYRQQLAQAEARDREKQSLTLYTVIEMDLEGTTSPDHIKWDRAEHEELIRVWPEIAVFIWELSYSPKIYVEMLQKEELHADESESLDMHSFTTKIYRKVISRIGVKSSLCKQFQEMAADQIYFFLEEVSVQMCDAFARGQSLVVKEISAVTQIVQKSEIVNFYVLFKIFKDTSRICRDGIVADLSEGLFQHIEMEVLEEFAMFIIEKYEVLKIEMGDEESPRKKIPITQRILNSNRVRWREAIREDGEIGILIELENEDQEGREENQNYMLRVNNDGEMSVMHTSSIHQKWKVCEKAQQNSDILKLIKNKKALAERMRNTSIDPPHKLTVIDNLNVIGGTMGRSLAEIGDYDNVGDFMGTLSKRMIIGGSLNYMLTSVPLLGYLFVTGGYTYSFYYIFKDKYANGDKKFREIKNMTIGTASSIGSGIVGATIGQTLIPVPILGAFIGGFVGGFLGEIGARTIGNLLQGSRFKEVIAELYNTIQPQGCWYVSPRTLKILEIKKDKFYDTIPKGLENQMNCDRMWMTLIFFVFLSFHESKERIKFTEKKVKEMKKKEKKIQNYSILQLEEEQEKQYEPSLHFICVMHYFDLHAISLLQYQDELCFIIDKMFTRLK